MATTNYTTLLGLALPTTGDLSGTWGTEVNNAITSLLDTAVAGTTTLSADTDVTLSTTNGAANQARSAVILWTATGTTTRYITAPAQSKAYIVINQTGGSQSIVIRGAGPTTGVTVTAGNKALVAWNGADFVKITGGPINLASSDVTGVLPYANGGTGQTSYTDGQLLIGNSVGNTLTKATLTAGTGVSITNGNGSISISATGSGGTVTSVALSGGTTGLTVSGSPITTSGTITLAGTLAVANGGTGTTTSTGTGSVVLSNSPSFTTPVLGTPTSGTLSNCTVDGTNSVGYKSVPAVGAKTTSYTLATTDVGKFVEIGTGGSIVIPNSTFSAGDVVSIFNNTAASATITCNTTTAYIAGTNTTKASVSLATRGVATVLFNSGTLCVITGNVS